VNRTRLIWATSVLVVAQVVHGAVPAETDSDTVVGAYVGLLLLGASAVAVVGVAQRRRWGSELAMMAGAAVAIGFVLYHAIPATTPLTNPYVGEAVGVAAWLSVAAAVAAGAWCAIEGRRARLDN
jgi:hypothetical protein